MFQKKVLTCLSSKGNLYGVFKWRSLWAMDSPCASRLSALASVSPSGPIFLSASGDIFEMVVRFMKLSTESPLENRADRDVGNT